MTAATAWPWSGTVCSAGGFSDRLQGLLELTQGWPVVGWETACRFSPAGLVPDRLLLALDPAAVPPARIRALPAALAMPAGLADEFLADCAGAEQILLALEGSPRGVETRAYLGFAAQGHPLQPGLTMRGFKWFGAQGQGAAQVRISDYWRVPLTAQALCQRLPSGDSGALAAAWAVPVRALQLALARGQTLAEIEYWAVTEPGSGRGSGCLRLYETGLCVADLADVLDELLGIWSLRSSASDQLLISMGQRSLGWVAAGVDAAGQPFVTIYVAAGPQDVRHLTAAGGQYAQ